MDQESPASEVVEESAPAEQAPVEQAPVEQAPAETQEPQAEVAEVAQTEEAINEEEKPVEEESPEWFMKDKFKTVEDQAKSYSELQKKMGKYWGTPQDSYSVEGMEGIESKDPLIENLMPALKDIGLSQDGFKHLVEGYKDANLKMVKTLEEELKKELTVNDAHTYKSVNKWMGENLTADEVSTVQNNWLLTPADFKLFNQMRLMAAPSTSIPSSSANDSIKFESSLEVENDKIKYRKEIKSNMKAKDKNYENDLASRFRDAKSREIRNR